MDPTQPTPDPPAADAPAVPPPEAAVEPAAGDDPLPYDHPLRLAEYDSETSKAVSELSLEADKAEQDHLRLKAQAANAKKVYDGLVVELRRLISHRRERRGQPPEPRQMTFDEVLPPVVVQGRSQPADDELWKKFPVAGWTEFGLTAADVAKLHAGELKEGGPHPIVTVGDLGRFVQPYPENPAFTRTYRDIKGFGGKAADRLSDAHDRFWAWYRAGGEAKFAAELAAQQGGDHGAGGGPVQAAAVQGGGDATDGGGEQRRAIRPDQGDGHRGGGQELRRPVYRR
jgi:hypothetical protein